MDEHGGHEDEVGRRGVATAWARGSAESIGCVHDVGVGEEEEVGVVVFDGLRCGEGEGVGACLASQRGVL